MKNRQNVAAAHDLQGPRFVHPAVEPQGQPTLVSPTVVETDFAELEDGTLIEMIGDPENASKTMLAVWKDGKASFTDRYHYRTSLGTCACPGARKIMNPSVCS